VKHIQVKGYPVQKLLFRHARTHTSHRLLYLDQ